MGKKLANTGETKEEEEEERSEGREREMSEEGEKRARLVIRELELENFKSYAGVQKVGPFHKVRCQKKRKRIERARARMPCRNRRRGGEYIHTARGE